MNSLARQDSAFVRMLRMLVLCTIVLGVLAPDAATAWRWWQAGRQQASLWVQVCSASGSRWMLMDASQSPAGMAETLDLAATDAGPGGADRHVAAKAQDSHASSWSCELSFWLPTLQPQATPAVRPPAEWSGSWGMLPDLAVLAQLWRHVQARAPPLSVSA